MKTARSCVVKGSWEVSEKFSNVLFIEFWMTRKNRRENDDEEEEEEEEEEKEK